MENQSAESLMNSFIKSHDNKSFINAYNLYLCTGHSSENSIFFKSVALLCYLADRNTVEFNKLMQSVKIQELANEHLEIVLNVSDSILRFDFESLKIILGKCPKALKMLVEEIAKNQQMIIESSKEHNAGEAEAITRVSEDVLDSLKDCVFVVKNFMGN